MVGTCYDRETGWSSEPPPPTTQHETNTRARLGRDRINALSGDLEIVEANGQTDRQTDKQSNHIGETQVIIRPHLT